jgi:hypothetical protein
MGEFSIGTLFEQKALELQGALGLKLGHPTSQGDLSEGRWIHFLKSFLPRKYAATKGFVFDSTGAMSEQIDVIVYDPLHSPLIYETDNGERYVTAESVYAVFEVKQKADKQNIAYADEKVQSVIALKRTSRAMVASGRPCPARELTHIIGGLLCTESVGVNTLARHIAKTKSIDIVCSATSGTFVKRDDGVESSNAEEAITYFFYVMLDELHKVGTVPAIDIRDYADLALSSARLERGEV